MRDIIGVRPCRKSLICGVAGTVKGWYFKYMKIRWIPLVIFLLAFAGQTRAADEKKQPYSSSFQSYKPSSTQKTFRLTSDGSSKNSSVTEYDNNRPAYEIWEDKDKDGKIQENEAPGVDADGDKLKGEQEGQIGTARVTQSQRIKVLNNMGSGKTLSSFQASGQIVRPSVYAKQSPKPPVMRPSASPAPQTQTAASTATTTPTRKPRKNAKSSPNAEKKDGKRVLVS